MTSALLNTLAALGALLAGILYLADGQNWPGAIWLTSAALWASTSYLSWRTWNMTRRPAP